MVNAIEVPSLPAIFGTTGNAKLISQALESGDAKVLNTLCYNKNLTAEQIRNLYDRSDLRVLSRWSLLTLPNLASEMIAELIFGEDISYNLKCIVARHSHAPEEAHVWFAMLSFSKVKISASV